MNLHQIKQTKNEIPWNKFKVFCFHCFWKFNRILCVFSFKVTRTFFNFGKNSNVFPPNYLHYFKTSSVLFFFPYVLPYQNILGTLLHHICHTCTPLTYENILYTFSLKNKKEEQTHFLILKFNFMKKVSFITFKRLRFVKVILFCWI